MWCLLIFDFCRGRIDGTVSRTRVRPKPQLRLGTTVLYNKFDILYHFIVLLSGVSRFSDEVWLATILCIL